MTSDNVMPVNIFTIHFRNIALLQHVEFAASIRIIHDLGSILECPAKQNQPRTETA